MQYWSNESNEIVNSYCGYLFTGHCTSGNLLDQYKTFTEKMKLDSSFVFHLGMDGPKVNLSFQEKLIDNLKGETGTNILKLGSCSLHPVHTAFEKGILVLPLDFDSLFHDLRFFFKYSSARRVDYQGMEKFTIVTAEFAKACKYKMVIHETCLCDSA